MGVYRGVKEALTIVKSEDKDNRITEYGLRLYCAQNKVKTLRSGKKILVNIESLREYMANGDVPDGEVVTAKS
jgi:hypothetical protein